jgi:hypothetical protein
MAVETGGRAVVSATRLLIVGVALSITGLISEAALVVQLLAYEPACHPVAAWSFLGACGALRILVLLMLPILGAGLVLVAVGIVLRLRRRRTT